MKRPLRLVGTTLAALSGLAVSAHADGPPGRQRQQRPDNDDAEEHRPAIVPVPPASEFDPSGGRRLEPRRLQHRPHPSHLDQVTAHLDQPGPGGRRLWHTTSGTFRNLVLLLRFSDHAFRPLPSRSDVSRLYNSEEAHTPDAADEDDVVPTGSVRQVYLANSHGSFTIDTTVVDWITLEHPEAHYADGNHGFNKFREAIIEGLNRLDRDGFDWADFDLDENGALDGLGVLHSGYGAEFGGADCRGAENESRIWSHKGGLDWTSSSQGDGDDAVEVNRYYVSSGLRGKCGSGIVRMGVICHELGHYLGLPDLYDPTFEGAGLGAYDFMSQSWGWDGSGLWPPNLSAWSRKKAGWANVEAIDSDGTYSLEASATNNKVYEITAGYPEGEYLLIENRQPLGYDSKMEGGGGIAIYHVDENSRQRKRGFPGQDGWPSNGEHYRVALLGADGGYDLERGTNQGDEGDLWNADSTMTELSSGEDGSGGVYPNTDSYQDGILGTTGIRIYGFSRSDDVMYFSIEGLGVWQETTSLGVQQGSVSLGAMMFAANASPPPTLAPVPPPTPEPVTPAPTAPPPTTEPTPPPNTPPPTPEPSTSMPSGRPSESPVTPSPTSHPTSPTPSSSRPTSSPTSPPSNFQPAHPLAASSPALGSITDTAQLAMSTTAPLTTQQGGPFCADLCLEPISRVECPSQPGILHGLNDCADVGPGELCDGDGECGTDNFLNNCAAYDVYRRVDCGDGGLGDGGGDDAAAFAVSGAAAGVWNSPLQQQSSSSSLVSPTGGEPTPAPTGSPSETPTVPVTGSADTNGDNSTGNNSNNNGSGGYAGYYESQQGNNDNDGDCPYYPGWNLGLSHCLKDCRQPPYMKANPAIFEFHSLEECCSLHYQGGATCRTESLLAMKKQLLQEGGLMANGVGGTIHGQAWRDVDGDGLLGRGEQDSMGGGVPDVPVDLYMCGKSRRPIGVGTRTSTDGTYLIEDVPVPGSYHVRVKPPAGYHLSMGHVVRTEEEYEFDSDFDEETGLSECIEFTSEGGSAFTLNAGLIPDAFPEEDETGGDNEMITKTELVSMAVEGGVEEWEEGEEDPKEDAKSSQFVGMHAKTHFPDTLSRNDTSQEVPIGNAASSPSLPTSSSNSHAKSFLRGSSSSSLSASITSSDTVTIDPTDDATIRSDTNINFVGGIGELRVGPQLSWHDDILLKFDLSPSALPEGRDYRAASHAVLRLYSLTSSPSGGVVHLATSSDDDDVDEWTEETVDWTSAPEANDGHVLAMVGPTRPNSWAEVDVTGMLLVETGVMTLRITSEGSNHSWAAEYSSKENGMGHPGPELRLYF